MGMLKGWELLIVDEEYKEAVGKLGEYCHFIEECIDSYITSVDTITTMAINDDAICAKLDNLKSLVESQKESVSTAGTILSSTCNGYISDIDEADGEVYDKLIGY
jgi:hypothetical protein